MVHDSLRSAKSALGKSMMAEVLKPNPNAVVLFEAFSQREALDALIKRIDSIGGK